MSVGRWIQKGIGIREMCKSKLQDEQPTETEAETGQAEVGADRVSNKERERLTSFNRRVIADRNSPFMYFANSSPQFCMTKWLGWICHYVVPRLTRTQKSSNSSDMYKPVRRKSLSNSRARIICTTCLPWLETSSVSERDFERSSWPERKTQCKTAFWKINPRNWPQPWNPQMLPDRSSTMVSINSRSRLACAELS